MDVAVRQRVRFAGPMDDRARALAIVRGEGFYPVRIASAETIAGAREAAHQALAAGRLAGMAWMDAAWIERATAPESFLAGARSVLLVAMPYRQEGFEPVDDAARGRIARYARGRDYHRVFEKRLRRAARIIREEFGAGARATVDYGPLLERPLAARAGMGWLGKSTMLLTPGLGPWLLLGAIVTTLDLVPDPPLRKTCGNCVRCIVACPTGAIAKDGGAVDARLCISYHTIENRGPIPRDLRVAFGDWIFGCDDCLDACPVGAGNCAGHEALAPSMAEEERPRLAPLLRLDEAAFRERYRGRAIMRAKRDGFLRNVCVALGNVGRRDDIAAVAAALDDPSPLVRGHAAWALGRLGVRLGARPDTAGALERRLETETDDQVREELMAALAECGTDKG